jgi:hypothetical protein
MPAKHPRCELCADNPPDQPCCWNFDIYDEVDAPTDDDLGMPYGVCRHCGATAPICDDCIGFRTLDLPTEEADACPTCQGWGVILPAKEASDR